MSDPAQRKILIAGDVRGKLGALYKRIAAVNKSAAGTAFASFHLSLVIMFALAVSLKPTAAHGSCAPLLEGRSATSQRAVIGRSQYSTSRCVCARLRYRL
jgi:hypothetical protein